MRIAFGTDEVTPVTEAMIDWLRSRGHEVTALDGTTLEGTPEWPEVGHAVGEAVGSGAAERGVVCCWTGTGVSIAANKVDGVRAALCTDAETARGSRRWNDANVLAVGLRLASTTIALEMLESFLDADPDPSEAATVARVEGDLSPTAVVRRPNDLSPPPSPADA